MYVSLRLRVCACVVVVVVVVVLGCDRGVTMRRQFQNDECRLFWGIWQMWKASSMFMVCCCCSCLPKKIARSQMTSLGLQKAPFECSAHGAEWFWHTARRVQQTRRGGFVNCLLLGLDFSDPCAQVCVCFGT